MSQHLSTADQEEMNDLVKELTILHAKIQYLLTCKKLSFREKIELEALRIKKKTLVRKLAPQLDKLKTIAPNIIKLL